MKVELAYGEGHLTVDLPDDRVTVIQPSDNPGLPDEEAAVTAALQRPIGARPLAETIGPADRVCIAFTDLTRATPNDRIIPWLLAHIGHVPRANITLLNQLGTHRPNTEAELETLREALKEIARWVNLDHLSQLQRLMNIEALVAAALSSDGRSE